MSTTVKVGPQFDLFVNELVESGAFATRGEVVREALQLLKDRQFLREYKLRSLRKDIAVADQQFKRGHYKVYKSDDLHLLTESIKKDGRKRLAAEKKNRNVARNSRV